VKKISAGWNPITKISRSKKKGRKKKKKTIGGGERKRGPLEQEKKKKSRPKSSGNPREGVYRLKDLAMKDGRKNGSTLPAKWVKRIKRGGVEKRGEVNP